MHGRTRRRKSTRARRVSGRRRGSQKRAKTRRRRTSGVRRRARKQRGSAAADIRPKVAIDAIITQFLKAIDANRTEVASEIVAKYKDSKDSKDSKELQEVKEELLDAINIVYGYGQMNRSIYEKKGLDVKYGTWEKLQTLKTDVEGGNETYELYEKMVTVIEDI